MRISVRAVSVPLLLALGLGVALAGDSVQAAPQTTLSVSMSNPACVQAPINSGSCYIIIRSLTASASDTSFTNLDIVIDGQVRARLQTFFESTFNATSAMFGQGLQVTCGRTGTSGDPAYGLLHQVAYKAYLFGNSTPAAFGAASVYCPAYDGIVYLPLIRK